ncbi:MAG TPA: cytochrome c oxidase subunit II [Candidatus Binataceae bacterium]|nr:cytochrome c oxidase subunit II [Candidatus Binataceae bacterium]
MSRGALLVSATAMGAAACFGCATRRELPMTTLAPKSDLAEWIYHLFIQVTLWDALILVIVVTAFILAVFVFSTRVGEAAPPSSAASDLGLEVAWTVGPALILLMISIPTVRTIFRSQPRVVPAGSLEVTVTAHQWWWEFHYPDSGVETADELHIPTGRPIFLHLLSNDVIHSFWVPQLGGKRDVVPGQMNNLTLEAFVPGTYLGQCAEFCGLSHANMRFRVMVETPEQFALWQTSEQAAPTPENENASRAISEGAKIFANSPCTTCHRIDGVSKGYIGPSLSHFGTRATLAGGILSNTPVNVAKWVTDPEAIKPGAQMPKLGLRGEQLNDLVAYLESLK